MTAPPSDATVIPRVGVAVLIIDHRGYVLIGKRIGSHGHGTLALPGGHLEHNETFEQCAARELEEETGIKIGSSSSISPIDPIQIDSHLLRSHAIEDDSQTFTEIKYLATIQSPNMTDGGIDEKPKHYITIFMKANLEPAEGEDEVIAEVREPAKCLGWLWVPISYLESVAASQSSLKRLRDAAEREGHALPVSLEKMLEAQKLAEAMRNSGEFKRHEGERTSGEESVEQKESSIISGSSALREQDLRENLERRPPLETISSSTPPQDISSPLALPSSIETSLPKPAPEPILMKGLGEEEDDEGPLPEAIQNLHAGRLRKSTSHSRSTSLSQSGGGGSPSTPLSPLRTSHGPFQNPLHPRSPSSPSTMNHSSRTSSPNISRSNLPRSPFFYHQDLNHPSHHHHSNPRSPSSTASNNFHPHHSPSNSRQTKSGQPPKPRDEDEETAWSLADDFTQGAPLFEPLRKLIESGMDLLS